MCVLWLCLDVAKVWYHVISSRANWLDEWELKEQRMGELSGPNDWKGGGEDGCVTGVQLSFR
jgi:hypothetical protein